MQTYTALLRGVNLGSHNRVAMADLRALFVALGFKDVATYLQSGNVVFATPSDSPASLAHAIEDQIEDVLGLDVTVVVRTKEDLAAVFDANPFLARGCDATKLHVTFLIERPDAKRAKQLNAGDWGDDQLEVRGPNVYLHCPNGYGRTKLNNTFLEKQLATAGTTRNWKTVTSLVELTDR